MAISKKTLIIGAVIIIALFTITAIALGSSATKKSGSSSALPTTAKQAKAAAAATLPTCLPDKGQLITGDSRTALFSKLVAQLTDVPAGTNLDVLFATDDNTTVTGSEHYSAGYGSYNYTAVRSGDSWNVTSLVACE